MGMITFFNSLFGAPTEKSSRGTAQQQSPITNTELIISEKEQAQDAKNRAFVAKIFQGIAIPPTGPNPGQLNTLFEMWQMTQKKMFRHADKKRITIRNKMIAENRHHEFKLVYCDNPPPADTGWKPFLMDAFTEPFPSTHDMDDWAMSTQAADILILHGVGITNAPNYYFHKKGHYVNHRLAQGIILFDLYQKDE